MMYTYVQKCMQWRNWRKIASRWRFELDAKSAPLEAGNFGDFGWQLGAISAIFANACISGHIS